MRLTTEEWEQLDDLIGKMGFGGYYDLLECLNMIAYDLAKVADIKVDRQKNLSDAYITIRGLTTILYRRKVGSATE